MYYSDVRQMNSGKKTDLICENDFLFPRQSANIVYYLLHLVLEYLELLLLHIGLLLPS